MVYKVNNQNAVSELKDAKEQTPIPLFPIEGFPEEIQNIIRTCSEIYRTPQDYWAGAVLIASALGIGNKMELVTNYSNFPMLWLVLVGPVSSGKSNPIDFCLNFFKKLDGRAIKKWEEDLSEFNRIIKMTVKERKAEGIDGKIKKPECFQYILNDFTPEAMVSAHMVNNRGLLIERDELKGWIDDFNRYNKSGEQSNMVTSYSGLGITYNRKSSGVLNIPKPFILVCGGMQPDLLPLLAADNRAENGFLSRLCAIYPDHAEKAVFNTTTLPKSILETWEKYLAKLVNLSVEYKLSLSIEAQKIYEIWFNRNAELINAEENGYLKGVYGKLDIISLRVAIILCGMNMACNGIYPDEITGEEMESAIAITEYFRATALKVYRRIFESLENNGLNKKTVAWYLFKELGMKKAQIAKTLGTSRAQINRSLAGLMNQT